MSDEAPPNSERLFQQAFAVEDPVPPLLQFLKEYPTHIAVRDLTIEYLEAVRENPFREQTLARLSNSPDAPIVGSDTLAAFINRNLADLHFKLHYWGDGVKEYDPKNTYLLESLLSGLSLKHALTSTSDMHAAIDDGLDAPDNSDQSEALVVGTCIQLLLHGSGIVRTVGTYRKEADTITSKLKVQKAAGSVKGPRAIQVLGAGIERSSL